MLSRPLDQVEVWLDGAWVGPPTTEAGPHQADKSPVATAAAAAAPPLEHYILAAAASTTAQCTLSTPLLPLVSDLDTRGPSGRYKGVLALWRTGRHPLLPPSLTSSDKQVCVQQGGQT